MHPSSAALLGAEWEAEPAETDGARAKRCKSSRYWRGYSPVGFDPCSVSSTGLPSGPVTVTTNPCLPRCRALFSAASIVTASAANFPIFLSLEVARTTYIATSVSSLNDATAPRVLVRWLQDWVIPKVV
jgi:hypothetical protein